MSFSFLQGGNLDFQTILVALSIVMNTILGILILVRKNNEYVNRVYVFNIACIIWWSVMIVFYRVAETHLLDWTMGLYVAPTFIASSFLYFSFLFPEEHPRIPYRAWYSWAIVGSNAFIAAATLIPGAIISNAAAVPGQENVITFGALYPLYALYISGFFGLGLLILARKMLLLDDKTRRRQLVYLLWGYMIASTFAMLTNLTLPYLGYFELNWLGQVLTVFMVLPVTYAIFRHRLFDVKVIATELITVGLWIFLLTRLLLDTSVRDKIIDGSLLLTMIAIGILLIRSVDQEVKQREFIEAQERDLQVANQQQETLLHFISHEIKGYLTKNEAAFDAIRSGDFGDTTPQLHDMASSALADTRKGVSTVMDILDASNLKKGTVTYRKEGFDLSESIQTVVNDLTSAAREKGLLLSYKKPSQDASPYAGDQEKLARHVIRNIIDNSIKYTGSGSVQAHLSRTESGYRFTVTDTGVGITPEDMARLFTEGGHGKDSIKVNVHSTGYGLYIAKQVVEAHGGKIWAESDGAGKGSRFIVELPTARVIQ